MARKPKEIPISTLRSLAASATVGFIYHGPAEGGTLDWAVDGGLYHVVKKRTTGGVRRAAHFCRSYRDRLTEQLRAMPPLSREYVRLELILVNPSWLCDQDGEFIDCLDTDGIMAAAGLITTVEMSE